MKKGLGRGFESLIPTDLFDESFDPTAGDDNKVSELRNIKLSEISADPDQPRKRFDTTALTELTESIKLHGVLQPIVVTNKNGSYLIVAGERRFRASKAAGLTTIPALVRTLSDQHKLELSLIENLQRHDLNALETATAYAKLRDQFNLSLEEIGHTVGGKSVSAVSNTLRLLRLPKEVQIEVAEGRLKEGQVRPLIDADPALIAAVLPQIIEGNWSARKIEQAVRDHKTGEKKPIAKSAQSHMDTTKQLSERLKASVRINSSTRGSGQIVISFKNSDELERITKTFL